MYYFAHLLFKHPTKKTHDCGDITKAYNKGILYVVCQGSYSMISS